jgi:hypothetical protein
MGRSYPNLEGLRVVVECLLSENLVLMSWLWYSLVGTEDSRETSSLSVSNNFPTSGTISQFLFASTNQKVAAEVRDWKARRTVTLPHPFPILFASQISPFETYVTSQAGKASRSKQRINNYLTIWKINLGAGIAQWYSAGLRAGWLVVRVPVGSGNFSPHHRVQTDSGAHLASYPMGTGGSSLGG